MESFGYFYGGLVVEYGINVVYDWVIGVDCDVKIVVFVGGDCVLYDCLIFSFGIDFVDGVVFGWDLLVQNVMFYVYKVGLQIELFKCQIELMLQGGIYVMVVLFNLYCCLFGLYECVLMVVYMLKEINLIVKILIVDLKEKFLK